MWKLKPEEAEEVVQKWMNEDFSVRSIQLDRGHWEYIVPILLQAALCHVYEEGEKPCPHFAHIPPDRLMTNIYRHACDQCWAELKEAAGRRG